MACPPAMILAQRAPHGATSHITTADDRSLVLYVKERVRTATVPRRRTVTTPQPRHDHFAYRCRELLLILAFTYSRYHLSIRHFSY